LEIGLNELWFMTIQQTGCILLPVKTSGLGTE
jgi:hypothetical protein